MEDYLIFNTLQDRKNPADYHKDYHIHLLCHGGEMSFTLGTTRLTVHEGDLLIWQMTTDFDDIACSEDFNADKLNLAPKYLSEICKDISDRMGFSSQAVLTRYLKRTLGMTPSEFRRKS